MSLSLSNIALANRCYQTRCSLNNFIWVCSLRFFWDLKNIFTQGVGLIFCKYYVRVVSFTDIPHANSKIVRPPLPR